MARPLFDSEYIFGLHDAGGEQLMLDAGKPGWVLFTEAIGHDPNEQGGMDYSSYSSRGLGVLCRLNNGYYPDGTIPPSSQYADFAQRCANFVAHTPGCKIWIIGNEMNYTIERPSAFARALPGVQAMPLERSSTSSTTSNSFTKAAQVVQGLWQNLVGGIKAMEPASPAPVASTSAPEVTKLLSGDPLGKGLPQRFNALHTATQRAAPTAQFAAALDTTEVITPALYAQCYQLCRTAIHALPGHADDQVLLGAVAPWNNQTTYAGNANGDWVQYFQDILNLLGASNCDGITLHTYTHQANRDLIVDESKMDPPFQNRHYQFRAYMDFMQAIPVGMRHLPVYITETNEDEPWLEKNIGWIQAAYGEINWWNHAQGAPVGNQQIRALVLYRWPRDIDRWGIQGKGAVIEDFQAALQNDYRWQASTIQPASFKQGDIVETLDDVNLRRTPGYVGKAADDVLFVAPLKSRLVVVNDASRSVDDLIWWNVQTQNVTPTVTGWIAQFRATGAVLLQVVDKPTKGSSDGMFAIGDKVRTKDTVRMRRTPGSVNKPANDVIAFIPADRVFTVTAGPTLLDNLTWWRAKGVGPDGANVEGWMAEAANGATLLALEPPATAPSTTFQIGDQVATRDVVRLRSTPGYVGKPASDVVANIGAGVQGKVLDGPRGADNLTWWQVETAANGVTVRGWMAEVGPDGSVLLQRVSTPPVPAPVSFAVGDLVVTTDIVRVRRSPGLTNKPADDVLGQFEPRTTLNILESAQNVDNLTWWHVGGVTLAIGEVTGWVAQRAPNGQVLIDWPAKLPGTNIPDKASRLYLAAPFQGQWGIAQLWGENPQTYSTISYDGVPLKGHNGIDFLTPIGTPILAVDSGVVTDAVLNDPSGFGNYIRLRHSWGESLYAHMDSLGVQQGQSVQRGTLLGRSGRSGFVDGPHLHFAIRINPYSRTDGWGGFSDPLPYMNPSDVQLPAYILSSTPPSASVRRVAPATNPLGVGYAPNRPGLRRP